jgi:hypothetical protein
MANWPSSSLSNPAYGMGDDFYKPMVKSDFEAGYVQSRQIATRGRRLFPMEWPLMPESQFATLITFANSNMGSTFTMSHAVTGEAMTCRFSDGYIRSTIRSPGYREVKVNVEEA